MKKATSSELTGGEGFTYEDLVVAYFLVALLREERAAATSGVVVRVAIQQAAQGEPLDDLIVDADLNAEKSRLSLQVKRSLTISAAVSNTDFREIIARSRATRRKADFRIGVDRYGFVARSVADERLGSLQRIIRRAQASTTGEEFASRFQTGGEASQLDITLRDDLRTLIEPADDNDEADFYRHLVALRLDNLELNGDRHAELVNRLSELTADGSGAGLLDSICQAARSGAGAAHVWNRPSLLGQLRKRIQLNVAPSYAEDIKTLTSLAEASVRDIRHDIDGIALDRAALSDKARTSVSTNRFVNIGGLPGCGKSVLLRGMVLEALAKGPVLFLKADRLEGVSWRSFATALGLRHAEPLEILAEIGSTGTDVLFVDGIDRIKSGQRSIVLDLLSVIEREPALSNWRVVATSRDQGLEVLRSWIPSSFYRGRGIENVPVAELNDEECTKLVEAKPQLTPLLFGPPAVREIARRPFFAAVLADQVARGLDGKTPPQTESELISVWWRAGGYAYRDDALPRQRAIIDLAEAGAATLGKAIPARNLQAPTLAQATALQADHIVEFLDEGARFSFTHDIFFEWAYFRLLIDRGGDWTNAIVAAGEPPLLGRIVSLYSQRMLEVGGDWAGEYRKLDRAELRPQWKRAWLLGPPASPNFVQHLQPFENLLFADNFALLGKFLVWFQAERTTPNALVLNNPAVSLDGAALVRAADYLGWPSDVTAWGRLLNWLLARQDQIPASSAALSVELFGVWQNMFSDFPNPLSKALLALAEVWLSELEKLGAIPPGKREPSRWDSLSGKGLGAFATALRQLILRSARGYPEPAARLVDRAIAIERRDQALFEEIIAFSPTLARSCPERLADLVRAEVVEDLPREKRDRERARRKAYYDRLTRIRAKPEAERTSLEKQTLSTISPIYGQERYDFDDVGIDRHHGAFFPPTPVTEPFASLFDAAPDIARGLVRDLSNRAVEGWRQVHEINHPRHGTPLPFALEFPWGPQRFWGDERTYDCFVGGGGPQPLECALWALTLWAHRSIDGGRPVDDVIRDVLEGHENSATLGLAVSLALQKGHVSETTLPLVTCQRLWHADLHRQMRESGRNIDLLGLNLSGQMTQAQRDAIAYLDGRTFRKRSVRDLVYPFVFGSDALLRDKLNAALKSFPDALPYSYKEQEEEGGETSGLLETARIWSHWGDRENYKVESVPDHPSAVVVSYDRPDTLPERVQRQTEESANALRDYTVINWASKSMEAGKVDPALDLIQALSFARTRDRDDLFTSIETDGRATQCAVASAAAIAVTFSTEKVDRDWGWTVLGRVFAATESEGSMRYGRNPYDPRLFLIRALFRDVESREPRNDSASLLLRMAADPNPNVSESALVGLLRLGEIAPSLTWLAAVLATELFGFHARSYDEDEYEHDRFQKREEERVQRQEKHRVDAARRALDRLQNQEEASLQGPPPPWIKVARRRARVERPDDEQWSRPSFDFDHQKAAKIVRFFPVEVWCSTPARKDAVLAYFDALVLWTTERLYPSWSDADTWERQASHMHEWLEALGDLLARAVPFLSSDEFIDRYMAKFCDTSHESAFYLIASLSSSVVCRHVHDAPTIVPSALVVLEHCAKCMLDTPSFDPHSYRGGEVTDYRFQRMIRSLLLVSVEKAPGAARFANGDWSDLPEYMQIVDLLVKRAGWCPYAMEQYLTLCERAGSKIGIEPFSGQVGASLDGLKLKPRLWIGTLIPARISGIVQLLADHNRPLNQADSGRLLLLLDQLIDLGDRRASALEQSEYFRGVQDA